MVLVTGIWSSKRLLKSYRLLISVNCLMSEKSIDQKIVPRTDAWENVLVYCLHDQAEDNRLITIFYLKHYFCFLLIISSNFQLCYYISKLFIRIVRSQHANNPTFIDRSIDCIWYSIKICPIKCFFQNLY